MQARSQPQAAPHTALLDKGTSLALLSHGEPAGGGPARDSNKGSEGSGNGPGLVTALDSHTAADQRTAPS